MDMLLLGETILANSGNNTLNGFWMPAGGNNGIGAVETFFVETADEFEVHLDTKSSDEDDSAAASIGNVAIDSTAPQLFKFDVADAKDLVRYRIKFGGSTTKILHCQFAQPLWTPN